MHRSSSLNRFSDEYSKHGGTRSPSPHRSSYSNFDGSTLLPTYDPIADLAKRERARLKFAGNAVHLIPFVLLLCAIVLWLFSNPDVGHVGDPIGTRIEGLSIEGEIENDSDGTQTGFLPIVNSEDLSTKELGNKVAINTKNF